MAGGGHRGLEGRGNPALARICTLCRPDHRFGTNENGAIQPRNYAAPLGGWDCIHRGRSPSGIAAIGTGREYGPAGCLCACTGHRGDASPARCAACLWPGGGMCGPIRPSALFSPRNINRIAGPCRPCGIMFCSRCRKSRPFHGFYRRWCAERFCRPWDRSGRFRNCRTALSARV